MKPALIFRGKGRVATEEKEKYDKKVDVYFQQNAWMDEEIGIGNDKEEKSSICRQCQLPNSIIP